MIKDEDLPELSQFRAVERTLPIHPDPSFGPLVVANQNEEIPVHRWFRLKESFSPRLLESVLGRLYTERPATLTLLDPFVGVGTSLLSAQLLPGTNITAIGIERNPFIAFAARTKLRWHEIPPGQLLRDAKRMLGRAEAHRPILPSLSSIRTGRCISLHTSRKILGLRDAIRQGTNAPVRDALLLGLAAAIEPTSKIRRDGRALRIIDRRGTRVLPAIMTQWEAIASDCETLRAQCSNPRLPLLLEGDGRDPLKLGIQPDSVDLVLTSPPYPNNIDYSEVYKLELWMLGFINDAADFLSLRRQTFRSHPTCATAIPSPDYLAAMRTGRLMTTLRPLFARAKDDPARLRVFQGYFSDVWTTLKNVLTCLKPGGHAVFVIGNSLHGTTEGAYLLPTDLVIAQMALRLGYEVSDTIIARNLRRRLSGNHFLRESLVVLQKPSG